MTMIGLGIAELIMMLRVGALYAWNRRILALLGTIWLVQMGVNGGLLRYGVPVQHNDIPGFTGGCTMIFDEKLGFWPSSTAWLPLIYDTVVFTLTVMKTYRSIRSKTAGLLMRALLRDGILYFSVIFVTNVVLCMMIIYSSAGLKNIVAQFELLITVTMMSRITLHLRTAARGSPDWLQTTAHDTLEIPLAFNVHRGPNSTVSSMSSCDEDVGYALRSLRTER